MVSRISNSFVKNRIEMPEILAIPDDLSLAGNLKKFEIRSDSSVTFELRDGADTILSQSYDPSPDDIITIDIRDIIQSRLSYAIFEASDIYEQPGLVKTFTAVIDGKEYPFRAIRSGVDRFQDSAANFLSANFLTWQPQSKKVTYYSPEYLSYYAVSTCTLIVEAHFPDGTSRRIEHQLSAGKAYTANLQYARIVPKVGGFFPGYYDVFVQDPSGNRLSYVQRYIVSDIRSEDEEWILFENTLGGLDTIRAYGSYDLTSDNTHNIAEIDERSSEYRVDILRKFAKNTGYLDSYERRWILDFFPSTGKYIISSGSLRKIVVHESEAVYKSRELPSSYTFTFSYADARPLLNLSRTPVLPKELHIAAPDQEPLPVPPRLAEFPDIMLSDGVMIPVQGSTSDSWSAVSIAALKNYLKVSGITGNFLTVDGDSSNTTVTFETAPEAGSFGSGDTLSVLFGQIKRWFSDLVTGRVVVGKSEDANRAETATKDDQGNVIRDTYATKTEVDQKVVGIYRFKGSIQNVAALLALTGVKRGDVYDVREAGILNGQPINSGDNVAATADNPTSAQWDNLAGKVDLSNYLPKTGDASDTTVTFVPESGELTSGAKQKTLWGRVAKKIADIISGVITVGKSNIANNLRSDKNFYLSYDGTDGIDSPHVILGATATDSSNQSIIQRILPFNLTVGRAVNDENGNNIPKTYAKKDEITAVKVGGRNYITGLRDNWEGGIVNSDGTITTGNNYNQVTKDYQDIAFLAGKTAIASVNPDDVISGSERLKLSFRIAFYTLDYLFISYESSDYNIAYKTLTVPDNAAYCKVSVGVDISGYVSGNFDKVRFQLELGNKETDYSPAPQDIPRINGEYPAMKVGKATADGEGNKIPDTYAAKNGTYSAMTVGKANLATNLQSNKNFYLGYDGTDGTETPYVILGATGTDNYNQSIIKRIRPANLTVGKAAADGNGNNIPATYLGKDFSYGAADPDTIRTNGGFFATAHLPDGWGYAHVYTMKGNNVGVMQFAFQIFGTEVAFRTTVSEQIDTWTEWTVMAKKSDLPTVTYSVDPPANPKNGDIHIVPTD